MKEEKSEVTQLKFGLIGKRLDYSFSKNYFTRKFEKEELAASYQNIELNDLENLKKEVEKLALFGFNVTIPFKEKIIPFLDFIHPKAKEIGAINCVAIDKDQKWIGHNTDVIGFEKSLLNLIKDERPRALIFGSGASSKTIQYVLKKLKINFHVVSRNEYYDTILYEDLTKEIIEQHKLLINTTPVGTFPAISQCIALPFEFVTKHHFCFDLIYNPEKTEFLKRAQDKGARIKNGIEMLEIQANESWIIWQNQMSQLES